MVRVVCAVCGGEEQGMYVCSYCLSSVVDGIG